MASYANLLVNRYDYHRGVDIPTPFESEAYAIDDGIVRIGGLFHSAYNDGVVQVDKTLYELLSTFVNHVNFLLMSCLL